MKVTGVCEGDRSVCVRKAGVFVREAGVCEGDRCVCEGASHLCKCVHTYLYSRTNWYVRAYDFS